MSEIRRARAIILLTIDQTFDLRKIEPGDKLSIYKCKICKRVSTLENGAKCIISYHFVCSQCIENPTKEIFVSSKKCHVCNEYLDPRYHMEFILLCDDCVQFRNTRISKNRLCDACMSNS